MAVGISKRPDTYSTFTLKDLDPLLENGNDIPTFLLEKFSTKNLNNCDKLRDFIYKHFPEQKDMEFITDLKSNEKTRGSILNKWSNQFSTIYKNNCPQELKFLLENMIRLDDYQLGLILNIISSSLLFCFIVFGSLGIESFIDNIVAQRLILKFGSIFQINKYVFNNSQNYHFLFGTNEKTRQGSDLLNVRCSIKSSQNKNETILKGHKWFVPNYCFHSNSKPCYILFTINEDIKLSSTDENSKIPLKKQFSLILVDNDKDFESKIQKLQVYKEGLVSYDELKFNSISLPYSINEMLLGTNGNGLSIMHYKTHMTQLFYSIAIVTNTQNTLNYIMHQATYNLEIMLQPPKFIKIIKTDNFKESLSQNYCELKLLISYCFAMIFDLKKKNDNENSNLNFPIGKLMIPQKCESIINWALKIMESKIFLQENYKLLYLKGVFYRFQSLDQSNSYLLHYIGKCRISWFLRIQRGLKAIKKKEDTFESNEEKENIVSNEYNNDTCLKPSSCCNSPVVPKSANSTTISSRSSIFSREAIKDVLRPLTPSNMIYLTTKHE
ncbi:hypothetical protein ACO0SA_000847 [Hanseniaspora valbyensis]